MIKFFRRIRQKLIAEGNLKKYLLYAFGEIILVVVGILIAVQINNWNSYKSDINELIKSYEQMHVSLDSDLKNLNWIIGSQVKAADAANLVMNHILKRQELTSELIRNIQIADNRPTFSPQSYTFEAIKLKGINLINNQELKNQLFLVYEERTADLEQKIEILEHTRKNYYTPWFTKNIIPDTINEYKVKDYNSVLNDYEFLGNLKELANDHWSLIRHARNLSIEIRNLRMQIEKELIRLKKGKKIPVQSEKKLVKFILEGYDSAKEVALSGPVVNWQDENYKMQYKNGKWEIEIELEPGHYLYQYFIDKELVPDKENQDSYPGGKNGEIFSVKYVPYEN